MKTWNGAQRTITVIAFAAALLVFGRWATGLGHHRFSGWTGYAPLERSAPFLSSGIPPWGRMLVWVGLIMLWALGAVALFGPKRES